MFIPCDTYHCKNRALFRITRPEKTGPELWCLSCFGEKVGEYAMAVERVDQQKDKETRAKSARTSALALSRPLVL